MKKIILFTVLVSIFSSCDKTEEFEKVYEYPKSIEVLTVDGDTAIIDNMSIQHQHGDYQIKIKKHK